MHEFSFIEKYLRPLSFGNKSALNLQDDVAIIPNKPGFDTIITKDALAEGTHFFKGDEARNLSKKLMRVNVSDLAAKGASPYCCFLALALPKTTDEKWLKEFASGLEDDLKEFGCFLAGGDTVVHDGPLILTLTIIGYVPSNKAILRSGALSGDYVFVTGTIGDSYRELQKILNSRSIGENLNSRYYVPLPRLNVGIKLAGIASASIDISDGLLADLSHICKCSKVGAQIYIHKIPLSNEGLQAENSDLNFRSKAITGGDDYEILFTAPSSMIENIEKIAKETGVPITHIGNIWDRDEIIVLDKSGSKIDLKNFGYKHQI